MAAMVPAADRTVGLMTVQAAGQMAGPEAALAMAAAGRTAAPGVNPAAGREKTAQEMSRAAAREKTPEVSPEAGQMTGPEVGRRVVPEAVRTAGRAAALTAQETVPVAQETVRAALSRNRSRWNSRQK